MRLVALLAKAVRGGKPVFTVEISPPENYRALSGTAETLELLKGLGLAGIAVTNNTGGGWRLSPLVVAGQVRRLLVDVPVVVHITARDEGSTRTIYEHLDRMQAMGVPDLLVLRGDPTPGGSRQADAYKFTTVELVAIMREYIERCGYSIDILVAGHPEYPPAALAKHAQYQRAKIERGAGAIIANIVLVPETYSRYLDALAARGIGVPVLPSVIPPVSARRCRFLREKIHVPLPAGLEEKLERLSREEAARLGRETAVRIALELLERGAPGINFNVIFPSDAEHVREILRELRGYGTIWEKYLIEPAEVEYLEEIRGRLAVRAGGEHTAWP